MAVAATSLLWPHYIMLEGRYKPKAAVKATGWLRGDRGGRDGGAGGDEDGGCNTEVVTVIAEVVMMEVVTEVEVVVITVAMTEVVDMMVTREVVMVEVPIVVLMATAF